MPMTICRLAQQCPLQEHHQMVAVKQNTHSTFTYCNSSHNINYCYITLYTENYNMSPLEEPVAAVSQGISGEEKMLLVCLTEAAGKIKLGLL